MTKDRNYFPCSKCGKVMHVDKLDAKPRSLAGRPATTAMLEVAADRGENFDILECEDCYGPTYVEN